MLVWKDKLTTANKEIEALKNKIKMLEEENDQLERQIVSEDISEDAIKECKRVAVPLINPLHRWILCKNGLYTLSTKENRFSPPPEGFVLYCQEKGIRPVGDVYWILLKDMKKYLKGRNYYMP